MDLFKLKTKKRVVGAVVLLSAVFFAFSASAQDHMMMNSGGDTGSTTGGDTDGGSGTVSVQDVNFDQILDIVTTGGAENKLNVFLGNGDGTFNQIFEAGLDIGVDMGLIAEEDQSMITFYKGMMTYHLVSTCSFDELGLPPELLGLLSNGGTGDC